MLTPFAPCARAAAPVPNGKDDRTASSATIRLRPWIFMVSAILNR
jgi:hypothetical protein